MEPYGGGMMPMPPVEPVYDQRYYWREMDSKPPELYAQQYQPPNLLQRISGLIKSQLPVLHSIMMQVNSGSVPRERELKRERSRSRSRSR